MTTEEVAKILEELGITLDDSPEDRHRFSSLTLLLAEFTIYISGLLPSDLNFKSPPSLRNYFRETAEEWLVG